MTPPPSSLAPVLGHPGQILQADRLQIHYPIYSAFLKQKIGAFKAVEDVSFCIPQGKTLGLVGESGSGKSSIAKALVGLVPLHAGSIVFAGTCISSLSPKDFFPYRKKIQMIFQDPFSSLNPKMTLFKILEEPLKIHFKHWTKAAYQDRIFALLDQVGLEANQAFRYPYEFSGGQRQRIGIARALAVEPEFIICDEIVSALDVSVQAQILNLLKDLQDTLKLSYLFISHDLAVVEHMSDHLIILQNGRIVEEGPASAVCSRPQHPYTQSLLEAVL